MTRALIVVDVQNDFCPGGALAVAEGDKVVEPLNRLIQQFLRNGELVVKTRDWHPATTPHFKDFGGVWPVHCVQETFGAAFHPKLIDDPRMVVVSKGMGQEDGYSGFDGTDLAQLLRQHDVTDLWIGGLATDYCVKNTALDALRYGFHVQLIEEAMRAVDVAAGDGLRAVGEMLHSGARLVANT